MVRTCFKKGWEWLGENAQIMKWGCTTCLPLLIFPCTIKSRSSLLAPAHPGGPRKRAIKWLWWWVMWPSPQTLWVLEHTARHVMNPFTETGFSMLVYLTSNDLNLTACYNLMKAWKHSIHWLMTTCTATSIAHCLAQDWHDRYYCPALLQATPLRSWTVTCMTFWCCYY